MGIIWEFCVKSLGIMCVCSTQHHTRLFSTTYIDVRIIYSMKRLVDLMPAAKSQSTFYFILLNSLHCVHPIARTMWELCRNTVEIVIIFAFSNHIAICTPERIRWLLWIIIRSLMGLLWGFFVKVAILHSYIAFKTINFLLLSVYSRTNCAFHEVC